MENSTIVKILELHGISHKIIDGKLFAEESYMFNGELHKDIIDITNISKNALYEWLGY